MLLIIIKWDFIGQTAIVNRLMVMIAASKLKNHPLEHILLIGPAGMGKTTIAKHIACEMNSQVHIIQGTSINKASDIISILTNLKPFDVVFLDEIHVVNAIILEVLYSALESNFINIVIGKDFNNKIIKIDLPFFTFIGATNKIGLLTKALISRFNTILQLQPYSQAEIAEIISFTAQKINWLIDYDIINQLINYCLFVPRLVINFINQVYNYCLVKKVKLTITNLPIIMNFLQIYYYGLGYLEVSYLKLFSCQNSVSLSLDTISSILNEEKQNIEYHCEPILLQLNLIVKTSKGRTLTKKGKKYLKMWVKN